jgi:hypothetical protein
MQVWSLLVGLAVVAPMAAGCLEPNPRQARDGPRPEDWDGGLELLAHLTGRAHSGAFDARVFPPDGARLGLPAFCVAYRAEKAYGNDACTVLTEGSEHWFPMGDPPWGLWGDWRGRAGDTADDPDPDLPRTLVAFDGAGRAVAFWDGAEHPDAAHATE